MGLVVLDAFGQQFEPLRCDNVAQHDGTIALEVVDDIGCQLRHPAIISDQVDADASAQIVQISNGATLQRSSAA